MPRTRAGGDNLWGRMIRELRKEVRWSQRRLAEAAGINRHTLRALENGTARGDIFTIELILQGLGYELDIFKSDVSRPKDPGSSPPPIDLRTSAVDWLLNSRTTGA